MSATSPIEWTDATWNPVRGCSLVSPGCTNCYAMRVAHRFSKPGGVYAGLTMATKAGPVWTGEARTVEDLLHLPLRWKKPRRIFVNSMSDLFHEDVPDTFIDRVFAVMALSPRHTFQLLTKRPLRMASYLTSDPRDAWARAGDRVADTMEPQRYANISHVGQPGQLVSVFSRWPLPNVHLGVSVEDQARADERIPLLLQTPAAVRFVSYEPALGPVDFSGFLPIYRSNAAAWVSWIIIGGESSQGGAKARPFDIAWARSTVEQCRAAGVPVFVKQLGSTTVNWCLGNGHGEPEFYAECQAYEASESGQPCPTGYCACRGDRAGADPAEWPEDLRVREFPR